MVDASPEWWNRKLKVCPQAAKFRECGPILVNEQRMLFGDVVATGGHEYTVSTQILHLHMRDDSVTDVNDQPSENQGVDGISIEDEEEETENETGVQPTNGQRRKNKQFYLKHKVKKHKNVTTAQKIAQCLEQMVNNMSNQTQSTGSSSQNFPSYSISDCVACLEKIEGIEEGDD